MHQRNPAESRSKMMPRLLSACDIYQVSMGSALQTRSPNGAWQWLADNTCPSYK